MDPRPLRIGVVGLGFGATAHVPALRGLPGVEVAALAGRSRDKTTAEAERLGIESACVGVEALLEMNLDGVTLALPPDENEAAAAMILEHGLPLFSEKPIARSAATAERLAALARGVITAVDFEFAELETFRALKRVITAETLGRPRHVLVTWLVESWAQKSQDWSWKTDARHGGGVTALFGSHLLFLAEWFFGPVVHLGAALDHTATAGFAPPGSIPADDLAHLRLEHEDGTILSIAMGNASPGCRIHRWSVVFEGGMAILENLGKDYMAEFSLTIHPRDGETTLIGREPESTQDGRLPPIRHLMRRWLEAVRFGTSCEPGLAAGARVQELMESVYRISDCRAEAGV